MNAPANLGSGKWVKALDFSEAYFQFPISSRSRKYLKFHLNRQTYHFTALPFSLAVAPLEFTRVVKEVKLMAQSRGIRIHQYVDDWLLRASPLPKFADSTPRSSLLCAVNWYGWSICPNQSWSLNRSSNLSVTISTSPVVVYD